MRTVQELPFARAFARSLAAAIMMIAVARVAFASVSTPVAFGDLVRQSLAACIVTPESEDVVWEGGHVITYTHVHVDALVAGSLLGASEVWIRTRGGVIGRLGQAVEGEAVLTMGRPTLLFVRAPHAAIPVSAGGAYVVTARAEGQFPVTVDATGDSMLVPTGEAAPLVGRSPAGTPLFSRHPSEVLGGHKLDEARALVVRAWGLLHE